MKIQASKDADSAQEKGQDTLSSMKVDKKEKLTRDDAAPKVIEFGTTNRSANTIAQTNKVVTAAIDHAIPSLGRQKCNITSAIAASR